MRKKRYLNHSFQFLPRISTFLMNCRPFLGQGDVKSRRIGTWAAVRPVSCWAGMSKLAIGPVIVRLTARIGSAVRGLGRGRLGEVTSFNPLESRMNRAQGQATVNANGNEKLRTNEKYALVYYGCTWHYSTSTPPPGISLSLCIMLYYNTLHFWLPGWLVFIYRSCIFMFTRNNQRCNYHTILSQTNVIDI